ncbi:nucleotidyltransferase [Geothermobacter hydrogeniphilus]|uniref:tRNA(Met) cytidine acetate ligase n=1 Tax=Geothermobacter hydrogeniphilus TaxID=1969733 RepID=A0A2K2HBE8_9BACT|nr:nucleotidyltransferase [Geothermobacter hydrogeniphilus]PNU20570.1 nucleotidyltransferase [Geothermobacter hydrogeniphilus]
MKTVGLITEYNPFHNGHLHHLRESRRIAGATVAVAVMSGHFLQRGEPALIDKWRRTRMALAAGVDVVVELPFAWACNSAPVFAAGAVRCLDALGGVDALCFGSEGGSLAPLQKAAELLSRKRDHIEKETRRRLRQGVTYPAARAQVVAELADEETANLLAGPNNILGIAYLKALAQFDSPIRPLTLERIGAGYHDQQASGRIASATGIRAMLAKGEGVADYLPHESATVLTDAWLEGLCVDPEQLYRQLATVILRNPARLAEIYQVEHGLEKRLVEAARGCGEIGELVAAVKSRQLTRTRIQRVLCYVLLDVERALMKRTLASGPLYLHLLGCSERGRSWLAHTRQRRSLPLVQNFSRIHATLKRRYGADAVCYEEARRQLEMEERATQLYALLLKRRPLGSLQRDYLHDAVTV